MVEENHKNLVKALRNLIEKQTELTRKGSFDSAVIEQLRKQADVLVRKISQAGIIDSPEFKDLRAKLESSYKNLCLALKDRKNAANEELARLRKGKKTIHTYRNNI